MYRDLYKFTPPNWGKTFFMEDNQAITENLAAMSLNFFAFFPALANPATNPNAENTGYFANPAGPDGKQHAALGGQGISIVSYSKNQEEAFKFLEWFVKDETQKKWAELGGYTCSAAVLQSEEFRKATPVQRSLLPDHVHGEGLLGGAGIRRASDRDQQPRLSVHHRRRGHGQGRARRDSPRTGTRPSRNTDTCNSAGPGRRGMFPLRTF